VAPSPRSGSNSGRAAPLDRAPSPALDALLGEEDPSARFAAAVAARRVEYDAIVEMLLAHATPGVHRERAEAVARAIAAGCLGDQHLWRDLHLPHRRALRELIETFFEPFAADNVMDMRWKRFIYKRLCRWGGFNTCRAPSCSACTSYEECFGPGA
jgi:nitrogen fixation protein NifQ